MSKARIEQRRVTHRGKEFHFVSYETQEWFLMMAGKRWNVMPRDPAQPDDLLDRQLAQWLEANVFV